VRCEDSAILRGLRTHTRCTTLRLNVAYHSPLHRQTLGPWQPEGCSTNGWHCDKSAERLSTVSPCWAQAIEPVEYEGVKAVSFGYAGQGSAIMRGPMVSGAEI